MTANTWTAIVVEDTYDDQQLVSRILSYHGVEVFVAQNGDECLHLLTEIQPTVVITDLAMPNRDGWQTLIAIRSNVITAHIPVIAITAYHSAEIAEDVINAGFDGYFPKPINPQTFVDRLVKMIG